MSTFSYTIQEGNNVDIMNGLEADSVDVIFADSPYNIQAKEDKYASIDTLRNKKWKPHSHEYDTVDDYWLFTRNWLTAARRILKPNGSLFTTGTHHNIHHIGIMLKELGYWTVIEIAWAKPNSMPNVMLTAPTQAVEWVIWARKSEKVSHYYDSVAAKRYTDNNTNLRSYWLINKPSGRNFKYPGKKPVELIYRCIDIATKKDEPIVIVDPFSGSGTTGAAARKFQHHYLNDVSVTLIDNNKEAISITGARMAQPIDKIIKER